MLSRLRRPWTRPGPREILVEDPEQLGYRLAVEPLLAVMTPSEWYALEDAALDGRGPASPPVSGS